jgi:hypothetical protein
MRRPTVLSLPPHFVFLGSGIFAYTRSFPILRTVFPIGKKINRPVANYDYCHNVFNSYIAKILNETNVAEKNEDAVALAMLQVAANVSYF